VQAILERHLNETVLNAESVARLVSVQAMSESMPEDMGGNQRVSLQIQFDAVTGKVVGK